MKVSIITATYNSALTVRDTLNCIREQEHPDIEHIIVDGLSTDETLKIVHEFGHISKIISEKDKGIYDAMNKGIEAATGDVVAILNSDDIYVGPKVISAISSIFSDPSVQTSYADLQYVQQYNLNKIVRTWRSGSFNRRNFYYGWMPPHPTFFVRREVYEKVGLFNSSFRC